MVQNAYEIVFPDGEKLVIESEWELSNDAIESAVQEYLKRKGTSAAKEPKIPTRSDMDAPEGRMPQTPHVFDRLQEAIKKYSHLTYGFGSDTKAKKDCSSYVSCLLKDMGVEAGRMTTATILERKDWKNVQRNELSQGDLIVLPKNKDGIRHVGMYLGNGLVTHLSSGRNRVVNEPIDSFLKSRGGKIEAIKRPNYPIGNVEAMAKESSRRQLSEATARTSFPDYVQSRLDVGYGGAKADVSEEAVRLGQRLAVIERESKNEGLNPLLAAQYAKEAKEIKERLSKIDEEAFGKRLTPEQSEVLFREYEGHRARLDKLETEIKSDRASERVLSEKASEIDRVKKRMLEIEGLLRGRGTQTSYTAIKGWEQSIRASERRAGEVLHVNDAINEIRRWHKYVYSNPEHPESPLPRYRVLATDEDFRKAEDFLRSVAEKGQVSDYDYRKALEVFKESLNQKAVRGLETRQRPEGGIVSTALEEQRVSQAETERLRRAGEAFTNLLVATTSWGFGYGMPAALSVLGKAALGKAGLKAKEIAEMFKKGTDINKRLHQLGVENVMFMQYIDPTLATIIDVQRNDTLTREEFGILKAWLRNFGMAESLGTKIIEEGAPLWMGLIADGLVGLAGGTKALAKMRAEELDKLVRENVNKLSSALGRAEAIKLKEISELTALMNVARKASDLEDVSVGKLDTSHVKPAEPPVVRDTPDEKALLELIGSTRRKPEEPVRDVKPEDVKEAPVEEIKEKPVEEAKAKPVEEVKTAAPKPPEPVAQREQPVKPRKQTEKERLKNVKPALSKAEIEEIKTKLREIADDESYIEEWREFYKEVGARGSITKEPPRRELTIGKTKYSVSILPEEFANVKDRLVPPYPENYTAGKLLTYDEFVKEVDRRIRRIQREEVSAIKGESPSLRRTHSRKVEAFDDTPLLDSQVNKEGIPVKIIADRLKDGVYEVRTLNDLPYGRKAGWYKPSDLGLPDDYRVPEPKPEPKPKIKESAPKQEPVPKQKPAPKQKPEPKSKKAESAKETAKPVQKEKPPVSKPVGKSFLSSKAELARERINKRKKEGGQSLGTFGGKFTSDFIESIPDYAIIAADYLVKSGGNAAAAIKAFAKEFAELSKEQIKAIFDYAQGYRQIERVSDMFSEGKTPKEIATTLKQEFPKMTKEQMADVLAKGRELYEQAQEANRISAGKNIITREELSRYGKQLSESEGMTLIKMLRDAKDAGIVGESAQRLARSINDKPRPISYLETAALVSRKVELSKDIDSLTDDILKRTVEGSSTKDVEHLQVERELLVGMFHEVSEALRRGGTENSWAMTARKVGIGEDFSYAGLLREAEAKKGSKLTPAETAKIEKLYNTLVKQHEEVVKKLETAEKTLIKIQSEEGFESIVKQVGAQKRKDRSAIRETRTALKNEYLLLKASRGQTFGTSYVPRISKEEARILYKIVKTYVEEGVVTLREIVDRIRDEIDPELTERDIRDAISGYGFEASPRTLSEVTKRMAELRREIREDIKREKREQKLKEYAEKREQRAAEKETNRRQRLLDEIEALEHALAQGIDYRRPKVSKKVSKEIEELRFRRDMLKAQIRAELDSLIPQGVLSKVRIVQRAFRLTNPINRVFDVLSNTVVAIDRTVSASTRAGLDRVLFPRHEQRVSLGWSLPRLRAVAEGSRERWMREFLRQMKVGRYELIKKYDVTDLKTGISSIDVAVNTINRFAGATDIPFFDIHFRSVLAELAQVESGGKRWNPRAAQIFEEALTGRGHDQLVLDATDEAMKLIFTGDNMLSETIQSVRQTLKRMPGGEAINLAFDVVAPFPHIFSNLINYVTEHVPGIGLAKAGIIALEAYKRGAFTIAERRAINQLMQRQLFGIAYLVTGMLLAKKGVLKPEKVSKDKAYIDYGISEEIIGVPTILLFGASLHEINNARWGLTDAGNPTNVKPADKKRRMFYKTLVGLWANQPAVSGTERALRNLLSGQVEEYTLKTLSTTLIPGLFREWALRQANIRLGEDKESALKKFFERQDVEEKGFLDYLKARLPFLRETLKRK